MTARWIRPFDARQGITVAALAAMSLLALLVPSMATAAAATGEVAIKPQPSKAKTDLFEQDVKLRGAGKAKGRQVVLQVTDLSFGKVTEAKTSGQIVFARGQRKAVVRDVTLRVAAERTVVTGKVGKAGLVLLRAQGKSESLANTVGLRKAALALTAKGASALAAKLGLDSISPGHLGLLNLTAVQNDLPKEEPKPTPEAPKPDPDPYPYAAQCPVAKVEGGPGIGDAPGQIAGIATAPAFNAGTSQQVTGTAVEWGFLQSFRNYVLNVPTKGSLLTLDGASASAAGPAMAAPGAFFDFPVDAGTYEPGTEPDHSDDMLVAEGSGTVLFCKSGHGFNIVFKNPTVTIDGAASRIAVDIGANMHGTWHPFQRADIAELDLSAVEPQVSAGGNTILWEDIPVEMSADGAAATGLGDQYPAGTPLDTITVETTLDRPLLTECGVAAGIATAPTVDFTTAALPTLTDPVVRSGKSIGTINWGFRRATRGTVASPGGSFLPLGGATEAFPGSMGGGNSLPPSGGIGKFFRFPISSYTYEAGTAAPGDDRLIATSDATIGFCKPNTPSGNFGLIISKPTLIVDGANSRIVANAYSFAGPFMSSPAAGWAGGRVELVNLDTSAIDTTTGVGTVRWGEVNPDFEPLQNGIPVEGGLLTEALSLAGLTIAGTAAGGFDPVAAQIVLPAP